MTTMKDNCKFEHYIGFETIVFFHTSLGNSKHENCVPAPELSLAEGPEII